MMPITAKKFFLMPIPPTPNGRLHLGHIAGPYLRLDMLGRYLRTQGHNVDVVSAVDGFDSYVLWKGLQEQRAPEEVVRDYHRQIANDLRAMDVQVDDFLDLVQGPYAQRHARNAQRTVERLVASGVTETVTERVLYCPETSRYLAGAWLLGRCPYCQTDAGGYFCEACGALFRPEAMLNPQPRMGDSPLKWVEVESLFLKVANPDSLLRRMHASGAPPSIIEVISRFLERENNLIRLTAPGDWGVAWSPDRFANPRVLFESGWEYALTCADRSLEKDPDHGQAMLCNSDVTTLVSFGIDNAVLLLAGSVAVMDALQDHQSFDYVLTNYFYKLQGTKFSTSRLHVIWAADIVEKTPASSDGVRYFLCRESPEKGETNFAVEEFVEVVNVDLAGALDGRIDMALASIGAGQMLTVPSALRPALETAVAQLDQAFQLDAVSVRNAWEVLHQWMQRPDLDVMQQEQAYTWLKGLAYLGAPIMPRLSEYLWQCLGHDGLPALQSLFATSQPRESTLSRSHFLPLSPALLQPCLPHSLVLERTTNDA
ncbi:methionine--tRNA ligase [Pseudomonas sp. FP597]|uniref:Methionine--tRNA ligase n=2 Tax=Pseudomonas lactucae TaxID=2813360 RepID=A0A9X0Y930_9PSED|nr:MULTISPECIES: methionine--tRNA ligase [Pseudomonas]MBN2975763.1 methionine--tRNA ligase [Pseudomonas lactucae]MBN2985910.1 methionine--tRNA ligase [Pseudomonas lactucae]WLI08882.1 methionine--tRNA ligase [Pseudomonas sp. FP597]